MYYEIILLEPAIEFIEKLDIKFRAKTFRAIELLREFGTQLPMPHARKLTGYGLFELRVQIATRICRLFYFYQGNRIYVITSGYFKKSNKTSKSEIEKAQRIKEKYLGGIKP
jgi:phage-related protein